MKYQYNKWVIVLIFLSLSSVCLADNSVPTLLCVPFGKVCTVKAKFVDKPNTYYAQNICMAEYYLKILEINGKQLPGPLIAEPVYKDMMIVMEKEYMLKAYEVIYSEGEPKGWDDLPSQANYNIRNKVAIKPLYRDRE